MNRYITEAQRLEDADLIRYAAMRSHVAHDCGRCFPCAADIVLEQRIAEDRREARR